MEALVRAARIRLRHWRQDAACLRVRHLAFWAKHPAEGGSYLGHYVCLSYEKIVLPRELPGYLAILAVARKVLLHHGAVACRLCFLMEIGPYQGANLCLPAEASRQVYEKVNLVLGLLHVKPCQGYDKVNALHKILLCRLFCCSNGCYQVILRYCHVRNLRPSCLS